jgi:hypothetical protein
MRGKQGRGHRGDAADQEHLAVDGDVYARHGHNIRLCTQGDKLTMIRRSPALELDDLNELRTFLAILTEDSLSAATRRQGVTLAVVSKRPLRRGAELWRLRGPNGATASLAATERLRVAVGDVVHDGAVAGTGIMLKSVVAGGGSRRWPGRLGRVLPEWGGGNYKMVARTQPADREI